MKRGGDPGRLEGLEGLEGPRDFGGAGLSAALYSTIL